MHGKMRNWYRVENWFYIQSFSISSLPVCKTNTSVNVIVLCNVLSSKYQIYNSGLQLLLYNAFLPLEFS